MSENRNESRPVTAGQPRAPSGAAAMRASDIVLATVNARYSHCSMALRYLMANLGSLQPRAVLQEFKGDDRAADIAEQILACQPRIVGLGIYIWNVALLAEVAGILKRVRPDVILVLGGPEVADAANLPAMAALADHVVVGPGELTFATLCADHLAGRTSGRILSAPPPNLDDICLPYDLYDADDIAHRVIYVEASRGCSHRCDFCLSGNGRQTVQRFGEAQILSALADLWQRGARRFKFVDRALHLAVSPRLLRFFLERQQAGMFLHFEWIPEQLPEPLFDLLAQFAPGSVQLEAGIQSFDPVVTARIGRPQHPERVERHLRRLLNHTGVHVHADVLVGLPGETVESIAATFDRLVAIGCHEIQVGILKKLPGTDLGRHDTQWAMCYRGDPPYDLLQNGLIPFSWMQRLKRLAKVVDHIYNSGRFQTLARLLWPAGVSPFARLLDLSDFLQPHTGSSQGIALERLVLLLLDFVQTRSDIGMEQAKRALREDWQRTGQRHLPARLQSDEPTRRPRFGRDARDASVLPERQQRHHRPNDGRDPNER